MPINVKDNKGNHLGYIYGYQNEFENCFLVAVSEHVIEDYHIDFSKIDKIVAQEYGLTTWNGKIKEKEYQDFIKENRAKILEKDMESYYNDTVSDDNFVKKLLCISAKGRGLDHNFSYLYTREDILFIKGFLLVNISGLRHQGNYLIFNEDIDYIDEVEIENFKPIFGKIIKTPIIIQNNSFLKEYDHSHITRLVVKSGNVEVNIEPRIHINCKKGMHIQFRGYEDQSIYCDGVFYQVE